MRKLITTALIKKLVQIVYTDVVLPVAKKYVESTQNTYDDRALEFLNDFITEFLDSVDEKGVPKC
jgi:hypothetical protein